MLPDTDLTGALAIAERFRASIQGIIVKKDKGDIRFTVSLGVTV